MTDIATTQPRTTIYLRGLTLAECEDVARQAGSEAYRGRQLFQWLQRRGVRSFEEMKNLPKAFREWLEANAQLGGVASALASKTSIDGSTKFLFQLHDGKKVESVLMPDLKRNYWTLCLSSQVGCAVDCKFCVTGFNGFFRQMRVDEIVDQVLYARHHLLTERPDAIFRNLVYMGMGEPLLNPEAVIKSIRILSTREGVDLSPRRITVSTSGIVPGMIQLSEAETGACLALSLNAPSHEEREKIMPITKKYPLSDVLDVCRSYPFAKHKRVTFEYVLLAGLNDQPEHAKRLKKLVRGIPCKINLIPFNPNPTLPYGRPERETIDTFAEILKEDHLSVSVRWSKALDVDGACGQLAGDQRDRKRGAALQPKSDAALLAEGPVLGDLDFFSMVAAESAEEDEE